ncbi:MAG: metal-dependent hydrolase [Gammaproteobacteria bacterium]|nr:metal-dependent hydrolase [Gammaproteobacteria bacterium]
MDPFSQAALGAVVVQSVAHRELGLKGVIWGGLAGAFPDVDVLFTLPGDYFDQLQIHRGITHSLLFAPVAGPLMAYAIWRLENRRSMRAPSERRLGYWMIALTLAIWSHPILDYLTPYGTQLLAPLTDQRFALNAMPIIDPVYTLLLVVGIAAAFRFKDSVNVERAAFGVLVLSFCYIGLGGMLNVASKAEAEQQLLERGVTNAQIAAFPTIFQIFYRRIVARTPTDDYVGYLSMWNPCPIDWGVARRAGGNVASVVKTTREGEIFDWFAMGWTHHRARRTEDGLYVRTADLRYGLTQDPAESVFMLETTMSAMGTQSVPVFGGRSRPAPSLAFITGMFKAAFAPRCAGSTMANL